jgi:hypothetical protein
MDVLVDSIKEPCAFAFPRARMYGDAGSWRPGLEFVPTFNFKPSIPLMSRSLIDHIRIAVDSRKWESKRTI